MVSQRFASHFAHPATTASSAEPPPLVLLSEMRTLHAAALAAVKGPPHVFNTHGADVGGVVDAACVVADGCIGAAVRKTVAVPRVQTGAAIRRVIVMSTSGFA